MTLKDLHGAVGLWSEINELNEKLEKAQSEKSRLTASYSLAPGGAGDKERLQKAIEAIYQYEIELADRYSKLYLEKIRLQRFFRTIDDPIIRSALQLKYDPDEGKFLSWLQVAVKIYGAGASADGIRKACIRYLVKREDF